MPENISQFDFSKPEDQEKFDKLPQKQKNAHIEDSQEEAVIEELKSLLKDGDIEKMQELFDNYEISEEKLHSPEIQEAAFEGIVNNFKKESISSALEIPQIFPLPEEKLHSPEIQEAAFERIVKNLKEEFIDSALVIQQTFPLPEEKLNSPELQEAAFEGIVSNFKKGWVDTVKEIQQTFPLPEEKLNSPEFQEAVFEGIISSFEKGWINNVREIQQAFPLPEEKLQEVVFEGIVVNLRKRNVYDAKQIQQIFPLPKEKLNSLEFQEVAFEGIVENPKKGSIDKALDIQQTFPLLEEKLQEAAFKGIVRNLKENWVDKAQKIQQAFPLPEEKLNSPEFQEVAFEGIVENLKKGSIDKALDIQQTFPLLEEKLNFSEMQKVAFKGIIVNLEKGEIDKVIKIKENFQLSEEKLKLHIFEMHTNNQLGKLHDIEEKDLIELFGENLVPVEYQDKNLTYIENIQNYYSNKDKEGVEELEGEEKYKNIFENLQNLKEMVWDSEGNDHEIAKAFERGAEIFGYEKMFKFMAQHNRHDALFAFDKIISLYEKSGLNPEQFFGQILHQVRMDSSTDTVEEQIDAYQKLNNLAESLENIDFAEVLQKAEEYKDISSMEKLLREIQSPQDIFTNWKMLKKFGDIVDLLNKSEILDELKELPEDKKELKQYIETLIFHPNINTTAVLEFWRNPDSFLGVGDKHSSHAHELKKPSNYTDIPYLQLNAEDLRDALVEGDLDKIQGFSSMQMELAVPVDAEMLNLSLVELTKKALGSYREKIKGEAKNPKKLFSQVQKLFKEQKINLQEFLSGKIELSGEASKQLRDLLLKSENGLQLKTKEFRAKISDKSDPDAVVAGNDTACCMPFGSGKNNVYTYNPNCGQFVIQEKSGDKWKTIAQSVLTKDIDIRMNIPKIVEMASSGHESMSNLATDEILEAQKEIIVCDNVEVTPNIGKSREYLETVYREFFKQYLAQNAESENLEKEEFLIGLGYNDLVFGNSIENTFLPVAPMGYSDNIGSKVNQVKLTERVSSAVFFTITERAHAQKEKRQLPQGISKLTFEDTLKVSYIEGKAYHDNQSLMEYMHNMENGLIAKDIYNAKNDRPNMSFAYTDNLGKMKGYIFAYEGQMNDENVIYVADLAALPDAKMVGGKLISAFLQEYKKQYLDKGDYRGILAHARDKTSYKIVEKQLNKLGKKISVEFEMEELGSRFEGEDEMHEIIIRKK